MQIDMPTGMGGPVFIGTYVRAAGHNQNSILAYIMLE